MFSRKAVTVIEEHSEQLRLFVINDNSPVIDQGQRAHENFSTMISNNNRQLLGEAQQRLLLSLTSQYLSMRLPLFFAGATPVPANTVIADKVVSSSYLNEEGWLGRINAPPLVSTNNNLSPRAIEAEEKEGDEDYLASCGIIRRVAKLG